MLRMFAMGAALTARAALAQVTALVGGTVYPSPDAAPIRNGIVLIEAGKIAAVGGRALLRGKKLSATVDCAGLTITAGYWNSHVHFFERKWADVASIPAPELAAQIESMLARHGFTSVFDLGSAWENTRRLRDRVESGEVPGPRIRSTGEPLISSGAMPPDLVYAMMGTMKVPLPEVVGPMQAAAAAKKLLDAGGDGIKLMLKSPSASKPSFPAGAIGAAVDVAHGAGKPVFAHPSSGADVIAAAQGGVDVIAHTTPGSGPWDDTALAAMKKHHVALIPTLMILKAFMRHDRLSLEQRTADTGVGQLRAWVSTGGTVLFGTDVGAAEDDPTEEYSLMAAAGMSFRQILASLTTAPARRFGQPERCGKIAPGFDADLVVLARDPSVDVRALAGVRYTIRAGKIIYRSRE